MAHRAPFPCHHLPTRAKYGAARRPVRRPGRCPVLVNRYSAVFVPCIGLVLSGCSLITNVDRSKIDEGSGGTAATSGAGGDSSVAGNASGGTDAANSSTGGSTDAGGAGGGTTNEGGSGGASGSNGST
jgi:hypothetical protein